MRLSLFERMIFYDVDFSELFIIFLFALFFELESDK